MAIEQWHVDSPKTIDLELVRHVKINFIGGACNVIAHDEPTTRVEVSEVTGRDLKIAIDGDTLVIDHPQFAWGALGASARSLVEPRKASVSVLVPKQVSVNVKATSADVLVMGVDGDISITTVGGEHFADNTSGKLNLVSASGELSVRGHRGAIEARTVSGDVTAAGEITSYDGNTISGSTVVDVAGAAAAPVSISNISVSGPVSVRLADDSPASVHLTAVTAKAQIGEDLVDSLFGKQWRRPAPADAAAATEIKLSTVAGRVTVLGAELGEADTAQAAPADATDGGPATTAADATSDQAAPASQGGDTASTAGADTATGQSAAWTVPNMPNVDLSGAPRPDSNIVPPQPGSAAPTGHAPEGTRTAATPGEVPPPVAPDVSGVPDPAHESPTLGRDEREEDR